VAFVGDLVSRGKQRLAPGRTLTWWAVVPLSPANVAFSCWRGLASSVKARQRLYRRKMQGRASPLQRDVRTPFEVGRPSGAYDLSRIHRQGVHGPRRRRTRAAAVPRSSGQIRNPA